MIYLNRTIRPISNHQSSPFRKEALVHQGYILGGAFFGLERVVIYVEDFEAIVGEKFIPDLFDARQSATREHILHALHLNVEQFVGGRLSKAEIQLETAKDWLLIDL